jgi:hypothetical protein
MMEQRLAGVDFLHPAMTKAAADGLYWCQFLPQCSSRLSAQVAPLGWDFPKFMQLYCKAKAMVSSSFVGEIQGKMASFWVLFIALLPRIISRDRGVIVTYVISNCESQ